MLRVLTGDSLPLLDVIERSGKVVPIEFRDRYPGEHKELFEQG
jgi:hypothetical protein